MIVLQYPQWRNLRWIFIFSGIAIDVCGVSTFDDRFQISLRNIRRKFFQYFECQLRIRQATLGIELIRTDLRITDRQVKTTVRRQPSQQDFREIL